MAQNITQNCRKIDINPDHTENTVGEEDNVSREAVVSHGTLRQRKTGGHPPTDTDFKRSESKGTMTSFTSEHREVKLLILTILIATLLAVFMVVGFYYLHQVFKLFI